MNQDETSLDGEQFEPILSDEDIDDDGQFQDMEFDFGDESEELSKTFNPFTCEIQPLIYMKDPAIPPTEAELMRKAHESKLSKEPIPKVRLPNGVVLQNSFQSDVPLEARRVEELVLNFEDVTGKSEVKESWVHAAEQVSAVIIPGLAHTHKREDVLDRLIMWVRVGLNFEMAVKQPMPGYKIRHIKAGVRLVETLCLCGQSTAELLLQKEPLFERLLHLYHQECMALSIRLMILRALDASLGCDSAVKQFLELRTTLPNANGLHVANSNSVDTKELSSSNNSDKWKRKDTDINYKEEDRTLNGYQVLLLMYKGSQLSRAKFAISSLLRKLNFYEVLEKLRTTVRVLAEQKTVSGEGEGDCVETADPDTVDTLAACLSEVTFVYTQAPLLLSHPKRFLPAHAQFDSGASVQDQLRPYPSLFAFLRAHSFLECCSVILTSPLTMNCGTLTGPVHEMLRVLSESQEGLQFLATSTEVTNVLLRILLQPSSAEEVLDETTVAPPSSQYLGLCLAYRLQAFHFVDQILEAISSGPSDPERQEIFDSVLGLYCLGFTTLGKLSVAYVLSCGDFMKVFLSLLRHPLTEADTKYRKCPGRNFVVDLVLNTVKLSDSGTFLQRFGRDILDVASRSNTRLQEVVPFLKILEAPSSLFSFDDIGPLCDIVKRNVEVSASLPGELITALRVLRHLAAPASGPDWASCQYSHRELKNKLVLLELFAQDGVTHLTGVLSQVCAAFEQPALHVGSFQGIRGHALVSVLLPALELLRQMLTLVIQCRNTEFRDLTAIGTLLQTYSLLHAVPSTALAGEAARRACREVIDTLLAYTQPVQPDSLSETEGLSKSLWTLMIAEVLKFVTTNAHTFMPGLLILSELLPLPLPMQSRSALPRSEVARAVSSRKLWGAHLHSLSSAIGEVISSLCGSSCPPLLQLLRRVCVQLADLAAPTALCVARSILDAVLVSMNVATKPQASSPPPAEGPASGHTARVLNFLACLVGHASVKSAVMQLVWSGSRGSGLKSDERFPQLVPLLCRILRHYYDVPGHIQAQECVVSVIQSLCDAEVCLLPHCSESSLQFLACAMPPRDLLSMFCAVLLDHVANTQHSFTTLLPAVRTFLMLAEHDYGFYHLKSCMEKKTDALLNLFVKFCSSFSKDSSDLLSTLSTTLELLRVCISVEGEDSETENSRSKQAHRQSDVNSNPSKMVVDSQPKEESEPMEVDDKVVSGRSDSLLPNNPSRVQEKLEVNVKEEPIDMEGEASCAKKKMEHCMEQSPELAQQNECSSQSLQNHVGHHHAPHHHVKPSEVDTPGLPPRKIVLSISELAWDLGWHRPDVSITTEDAEKDVNRKRHPIFSLEKLLHDCCVEEESLESLHENVVGLIRLLEDEGSEPPESRVDITEMLLPPAEPLLSQFAARPVFTICEPDDDRLCQGYWLSVPTSDDADQDVEQVVCDLLELARVHIPDFHLLSESARLCRLRVGLGEDEDADRTDADSAKKRAGGDDMKYINADLKTRRPFVTPMRGRGFSRPAPQRGDLFRSRPPNTSRPPSLHVDDFVALETCGAQPTGPTGYNKMSMRAAKDMMATRSRGRGRGFGSDRGRFFGSAPQYRRGNLRASNNLRGDMASNWSSHDGQAQVSGSGPQRTFRTPDQPRDVRMIRSEEKQGSVGLSGRLGAGQRASGLGGWPSGGRDRGANRGGRRDSARHQRTFTR